MPMGTNIGSKTVWVFLGGLIVGAVLAYFLSFSVNVGVKFPAATTPATSTPAITNTPSTPTYTSTTAGAYQP